MVTFEVENMVPSSPCPNLNCFMRGQQVDQGLLLPGGKGARARWSLGGPVLWHSRAEILSRGAVVHQMDLSVLAP